MEGLKRRVTYSKPSALINWLLNLKIWLLTRTVSERVTLYFRTATATNISEPIKDLIYKTKGGVFKTVKLGISINDELPNKYINTDSAGRPYMEGIFRQGQGFFQFIKADPEKLNFESTDIRLNDIFQDTARKLLKLFEWDKEKQMMMIFLVSGLIAMGLFIAFGLTGLGNVINAGIEKLATEVTSSVPTTAIPPAP